jgi:hypothetical protein
MLGLKLQAFAFPELIMISIAQMWILWVAYLGGDNVPTVYIVQHSSWTLGPILGTPLRFPSVKIGVVHLESTETQTPCTHNWCIVFIAVCVNHFAWHASLLKTF